jgi:hypothetical protein
MNGPAIAAVICRELRALERELNAYQSEEQVWALPPGIPNSGGTLALHRPLERLRTQSPLTSREQGPPQSLIHDAVAAHLGEGEQQRISSPRSRVVRGQPRRCAPHPPRRIASPCAPTPSGALFK